MANTVTIRKLMEGAKSVVLHVYLKCDGASGELTDQVLLDPTTDVTPALTAASKFTIEEIWYDLSGFDAQLEYDATTDTPIWTLVGASGTTGEHKDFRSFGGIRDSGGAGATGKIQVTTTGFTAATDQGTIILRIRKEV